MVHVTKINNAIACNKCSYFLDQSKGEFATRLVFILTNTSEILHSDDSSVNGKFLIRQYSDPELLGLHTPSLFE